MRDQLVIRNALKSDFLEWKVLWDNYNAFYGRTGVTALTPEITQTTWSRFFDVYEPMHAMVAETSDGLVGLVHFLYHRNTIQLAPSCYLQDLFTAESTRGLGVGRALINAVYQHAEASGVPRVYWQTRETNTTAIQLYDKIAEKTGFIVYHKKFL